MPKEKVMVYKEEAKERKQQTLKAEADAFHKTREGEIALHKYEGQMALYISKKFPELQYNEVNALAQFGGQMMLTLAAAKPLSKTNLMLRTVNPLDAGKAKRFLVQNYLKAMIRNPDAYKEFKNTFSAANKQEAAAIAVDRVARIVDKHIATLHRGPRSILENMMSNIGDMIPGNERAKAVKEKFARNYLRAGALYTSTVTLGTMGPNLALDWGKSLKKNLESGFASNPTFPTSIEQANSRSFDSLPSDVRASAEKTNLGLRKDSSNKTVPIDDMVETMGAVNRDLISFHKLATDTSLNNGAGYILVETSTPPKHEGKIVTNAPTSRFVMRMPKEFLDQFPSNTKCHAKIENGHMINKTPAIKEPKPDTKAQKTGLGKV